MVFCRHCGAQMHESAVACPSCGAPSVQSEIEMSGGYFSFRGRIGRQTYWLHYILPLIAVSIAASILDVILFGQGRVLGTLVGLATLVPNLASGVKRCHDRDRSGWFLLISFIPFIGILWLAIELGFLRGTTGRNRFGLDPLLGTIRGSYR